MNELLASNSKEEEVAAATSLEKAYQMLLDEIVKNQSFANESPKQTKGGVALSSQHALDCIKDPLRTTRFLKGIYSAINDAQEMFKNEQINLVYAGSGPSAVLILPLLSLFKPEELAVTLIDINETSIHSVASLIRALDFESYFSELVNGDAITYQFDSEKDLHIVVSETMDKALTREPQVSIVQNFIPQLVENGILIPQSIDIYSEHTFYAKEPYFDIYKNVLQLGPTYPAIDKLFLFSISKETPIEAVFEFESTQISVPENFIETPDISLVAEVVIYKDLILNKSESLLSNPYCVASLYNVSTEIYKLHYHSEGNPNWELIPI